MVRALLYCVGIARKTKFNVLKNWNDGSPAICAKSVLKFTNHNFVLRPF